MSAQFDPILGQVRDGTVTLAEQTAGFNKGTAAEKADFQYSVSGAEVAPIFAGDVVQTTYSISVRSGPGWLTEVYCASGSAVLLSVYDNNATGTGRVVFTDTFSAGRRVTGRWPLVNGAVALFDTGVFEFVFSGE